MYHRPTSSTYQSYAVTISKPSDVRLVQEKRVDLYVDSSFRYHAAPVDYRYEGMIVAVVNDGIGEGSDTGVDNNGIYLLVDYDNRDNYRGWKKLDIILPTTEGVYSLAIDEYGEYYWVNAVQELKDLNDVDDNLSPNDGDILQYDSGTGQWITATVPEPIAYTGNYDSNDGVGNPYLVTIEISNGHVISAHSYTMPVADATASNDGIATAYDVQTYVDDVISQIEINIVGGDAIEITEDSSNTKEINVVLDEVTQTQGLTQNSGLEITNEGLRIKDSLQWILNCGSASVNIES